MRINIPEKFTKDEFDKLTNRRLNNNEFQQYISLFKNNYKKAKGEADYCLKGDVSNETLFQIDYVLKRLGMGQFETLTDMAKYFRTLLDDKKYIVLFAYNGTGKTRLSCEFKSLGQILDEDSGEKSADTLYYNAFTEDLFYWDNDLENDTERVLKLNGSSRFFAGLNELEMESRIRPLLQKYATFNFSINYETSTVNFSRDIIIDGTLQTVDNIKVSRGEENIFIWCFFLAIVNLIKDKVESYNWVKYIYIDDPISSLDDNNAIAVACHLAQIIKDCDVKVVTSTHHALFFNVLCNEIGSAEQLFLQKSTNGKEYILKDTRKTPFFHHVALLKELKKAADSGELYTYHFNILRNILEKTASFHGYAHFSSCVRKNDDDADGMIHKRMLDLLSHGNYSLFDPKEMVEENKNHFRNILNNFLEDYNFNEAILGNSQNQEEHV